MSDFEKWDHRFMRMATLVASWSKDGVGVGCVIVNDSRIVTGVGFNGFPRGVTDSPERYADDKIKNKLVVHAEANALMNSSSSAEGGALYCTRHPCSDCAKLIVQSGLRFVICPPAKTEGKWAEDADFAKLILNEGFVETQIYDGPIEELINFMRLQEQSRD